MKKVVLALAIVAMVGCFASCKKTCSCTTYVAGVAQNPVEVNLDDMEATFKVKVDKCSDMNSIVELPVVGKNGVVCK